MIVADRFIRPLFVVGDSHAVPCNGLLLSDHATRSPVAVGQAYFIPKIRADQTMDESGRVHSGLAAALAACCVISHSPAPESAQVAIEHEGLLLGAHPWAQSRFVLFVIGSIDARDVIRSVPLDAEIDLPFAADFSALPGDGISRVVPAARIHDLIAQHYRPLFRTLVKLRAMGLPRLALASLPPPTTDDEVFFERHEIRSRARVRYQAHMFINSVFGDFCRQANVAFVDPWNDVTENNVVRDGWLPDGVHLGPQGAAALLGRYFEAAAGVAA